MDEPILPKLRRELSHTLVNMFWPIHVALVHAQSQRIMENLSASKWTYFDHIHWQCGGFRRITQHAIFQLKRQGYIEGRTLFDANREHIAVMQKAAKALDRYPMGFVEASQYRKLKDYPRRRKDVKFEMPSEASPVPA